jgi:hypothetical protein
MGIRFSCPNGHKLNVKTFLAGKRGVCPQCGAKFVVPPADESTDGNDAQSRAIGQSHSVEILSPSAIQTMSTVAAPSVIITVADSGITRAPTAPAVTQPQAGAAASIDEAATDWPPSIVNQAPPQTVPTNPAADSTQTQIASERRRARGLQAAISIALFATVIVLAFVLVIVMKRHLDETNAEAPASPASPATP